MHQLITQNQLNDSLTQYGDGIFETMLGVGNAIHHWNYHWARLQSSCERLEIAVPSQEQLYQTLQNALAEQQHALSVIKMIIGRGDGLRGYRSLPEQPCQVQFSVAAYALNPSLYQGLRLRVCETKLAAQPLLAGMKHCNRLEYIMARRESADTAFDEGLLLDYDSRLVEGLISNVFLMKKQRILTPSLAHAGVAGTMRAYLLDVLPNWGYETAVTTLTLADVAAADAVFMTNATGGVMPVKSIQGIEKTYEISAANSIRRQMEHPCSAL